MIPQTHKSVHLYILKNILAESLLQINYLLF